MTEFHKFNMRKHIAFLEDNAEEIRKSFDMWDLFHTCGTPSCSLGYATRSVGLPRRGLSVQTSATFKFFGVRWFDKKWSYMFDSTWEGINNTPEAAAARMKAVLYNQVPKGWEFKPEFSHPIVLIPSELEQANKLKPELI